MREYRVVRVREPGRASCLYVVAVGKAERAAGAQLAPPEVVETLRTSAPAVDVGGTASEISAVDPASTSGSGGGGRGGARRVAVFEDTPKGLWEAMEYVIQVNRLQQAKP